MEERSRDLGGDDPFDEGREGAEEAGDDAPLAAPTWAGAIGQMVAAVLVVLAVVSLFIAGAVALRRLVP